MQSGSVAKNDVNHNITPGRNGTEARNGFGAAEIRPTSAPPVDVYENDDEILVVADMPGAKADSVHIKFEKDELFITAKRDTDVTGQILYGGRRDCEYRRTFLVPRGIDATLISADMSDGVLKVRLPKSQAVKPRTIEVKTRN